MLKPKPIPVSLVCSLCGESWDLHPDDPTALDCIAILRAKPHTTVCGHTHYWPWYQGTYTTPTITTPTYYGTLTYSDSNN